MFEKIKNLFSQKPEFIVLPFGIIAVVLVIVGIIRCSSKSKDITTEVNAEVKETKTVAAITNKEEGLYALHTFKNFKYRVDFKIFTNEIHKNGYIIITKINVIDSERDTDVMYQIIKSDDPRLYIETIHNHAEFDAKNDGIHNLNDKDFNELFSTVQAMIMASFENETATPANEKVYEAGQRMIGRKVGLMR